MSDPYLGEIMLFAGNFPPKDWAVCEGQILPIAQNTALFSLLGTNFGGDGQRTFGLPKLIDCFPMGTGQGAGLTDRVLGETGGATQVTITTGQMAVHTHLPNAQSGGGNAGAPNGAVWSSSSTRDKQFSPGPPDVDMAANLIDPGPVGGGQAHANVSPGIALNYIICLKGIFPQRP